MTDHPMPASGGSYLRDPVTGALTLIDGSQTLSQAEAAALQAADAAAAPPPPAADANGPVDAPVAEDTPVRPRRTVKEG